MKKMMICAVTVFSLIAVSAVMAATYDYTFYPNYSGIDPTLNPVGGVTGDSVTGNDSWKGQGTTSIKNGKIAIFFDMQSLFQSASPITVGQLQSISYYTKKNAAYTQPDWYVEIYTDPVANTEKGTYSRINAEPYLANNLNAAANQWNKWSSDGDINGNYKLRFCDETQPSVGYGGYTDPYLSAITSGPIDWASYGWTGAGTVDYTAKKIQTVGISTGSSWAGTFFGQVDAIQFTLKSGDVANVNLEVPEPATMSLLVLGGLGLLRRKVRG